jgi:protein-tyrosine phosphatase
MYDIHHHLLYGLDDGPATLEASLAQAELAIADGITHLVCTPHASDRFSYKPEENAAKLAELQSRLGTRIKLGMGCDFHLSYENIEDAVAHPSKYSINGGQYLLIEFPDFGIPTRISEAMYELRLAGMTLIITHPERNQTLRTHPEKLAEWLREGHLIQVTAGALSGRFGRTAGKFAHELLAKHWVHFLATDAHDTETRPPKLREAYDAVTRDYGEEYARLLCISNPKAAFDSTEMPEQVLATGLFEEDEPEKKGFFSRLLRR